MNWNTTTNVGTKTVTIDADNYCLMEVTHNNGTAVITIDRYVSTGDQMTGVWSIRTPSLASACRVAEAYVALFVAGDLTA